MTVKKNPLRNQGALQSIPRLLVLSFARALQEAISLFFPLWFSGNALNEGPCRTEQNARKKKNQEFGKKGSELDSRRNVTSDCCRQLLERTSRTLRVGLRPPEAEKFPAGTRRSFFVGIKGQKNKTGRRVCFSHLLKCWQQSQIRISPVMRMR